MPAGTSESRPQIPAMAIPQCAGHGVNARTKMTSKATDSNLEQSSVPRSSRKRVFLGPLEVAGYVNSLFCGMKEIGLECDFVEFSAHRFGYRKDAHYVPLMIRVSRRLVGWRRKLGRIAGLPCTAGIHLAMVLFLIQAIFRYDVFIFAYGQSLLPANLDLPVLRLFGKRTIMILGFGTEARPAWCDGVHQSKDGTVELPISSIRDYARTAKRRVSRCEKWCSIIVGAPYSTSPFATRPMVNWFALGFPAIIENLATGTAAGGDNQRPGQLREKVRILHIPSHPAAKGSPEIRKAIASLKQKGHPIDFVELVDRTHAEVISEVLRCDFVVDQIYSDTPMAGFATEAAACGKAAVVGGYGLELLRRFVPDAMWPPTFCCSPESIEAAIEELIRNPEYRTALGESARKFVHDRWGSQKVAERYASLAEGDVPDEWMIDPGEVVYLHGFGQPADVTRRKIRELVGNFGVGSLQLAHRPELQERCLEFAGLSGQAVP
jgi:Glycosyl transferases group 1